MEAIRKIVKVKNSTVTFKLPADLPDGEVEVIVLFSAKEYQIPQWQVDQVRERTQKFIHNPESAMTSDDFFKEIEDDL